MNLVVVQTYSYNGQRSGQATWRCAELVEYALIEAVKCQHRAVKDREETSARFEQVSKDARRIPKESAGVVCHRRIR